MKLRTYLYLCKQCGEPPWEITMSDEGEPPDELRCLICGSLIHRLLSEENGKVG